jgi:hypothetical protein
MVGVAITLLPVDALKLAEGLQVYEAAPLTVNVFEDPKQIVDDGIIDNVGVVVTLIVVMALLVHVPIVPITVYVVVMVGVAVTVDNDVELKLLPGLQV